MPRSTSTLVLLLAVLAGPAVAQPHVRTETGRLDPSDSQLDGGEFLDVYDMDVPADVAVEVRLVSDDFDTYLIVEAPDGSTVQNDDHEGSQRISLVRIPGGAGGAYRVAVTSYAAGETGAYRLDLTTERPAAAMAPAPRPAGAATPGGGARPQPAVLPVGTRVLVRTPMPLPWSEADIIEVNPDGFPDTYKVGFPSRYGGYSSYDIAWYSDVAGPARERWWTEVFVGDWEVSTVMSMTTSQEGNESYRMVTGPRSLPPLRIHADGTYTWRVEEWFGGRTEDRTVEGRWEPIPTHPGLILKAAAGGVDWMVNLSTDRSIRQTFGRDEIEIEALAESDRILTPFLEALRR